MCLLHFFRFYFVVYSMSFRHNMNQYTRNSCCFYTPFIKTVFLGLYIFTNEKNNVCNTGSNFQCNCIDQRAIFL